MFALCVTIHNTLKQEYFSQAPTAVDIHNPTYRKGANQLEVTEGLIKALKLNF